MRASVLIRFVIPRADGLHLSASVSTRSFAALRHPGYRAFFFLSAAAMMADSIEHVISYWVIFKKFQSPMLAGYAVISHWLPFLLFSVHAGALADRFDPRRMIQIGMGLFMFVSLSWGVLFLTDTLEMWHALVLLAIHGIAGVFWLPATQILIHDIVSAAELQSAIRLQASVRYLGFLAGPAVGGALLLAFGPSYGILLNALFYAPFAVWLVRAPYGPRFRAAPAPSRVAVRGFREILATASDIASHRTIVAMTLLAGCASLLIGTAYQPQMPEYAHDLGHADADFSYTMLLGADAMGALLAALVLEGRGLLPPHPRTALVLALAWCCSLAGFAVSKIYVLSLALLFTAGFVELAFNSMAQTIVQLQAPPAIRGRVIGLYITAALGMRTFSGVTVGVVGGLIGIHASLALSATMLLAIVLALLVFAVRSPAATP
jgi:MFS family permease